MVSQYALVHASENSDDSQREPSLSRLNDTRSLSATRLRFRGFPSSHSLNNLAQIAIETRLSRDIENLHKELQVTCHERDIYSIVFKNISQTILQHDLYPTARVKLFGSSALGTAFSGGDLDVAICISPSMYRESPFGILERVLGRLELYGIAQKGTGKYKTIPQRDNPIYLLKFEAVTGNIPVDLALSMSYDFPPAVNFLDGACNWLREHKLLAGIYSVMKLYFKVNNLSNLPEGGIPSYGLLVLIRGFLERQRLKMDLKSYTDLGYGQALLGFMEFFSKREIWFEGGQASDGTMVPKNILQRRSGEGVSPVFLLIIDPANPENNITAASFMAHKACEKVGEGLLTLRSRWATGPLTAQSVRSAFTSVFQVTAAMSQRRLEFQCLEAPRLEVFTPLCQASYYPDYPVYMQNGISYYEVMAYLSPEEIYIYWPTLLINVNDGNAADLP